MSVPSLADLNSYRPELEVLRYVHRPDEMQEHEFFRLNEDGARLVNLHVCETGGGFERDTLAFRDQLRADPRIAAEYEALKQELASRYPDQRWRYTEEKSEFIRSVLAGGDVPDLVP